MAGEKYRNNSETVSSENHRLRPGKRGYFFTLNAWLIAYYRCLTAVLTFTLRGGWYSILFNCILRSKMIDAMAYGRHFRYWQAPHLQLPIISATRPNASGMLSRGDLHLCCMNDKRSSGNVSSEWRYKENLPYSSILNVKLLAWETHNKKIM